MQATRSVLKQLALNTTLHGCRHLAEDDRHWLERVLWAVVLSVALWGTVTTIIDVYQEYDGSPAVTSLESSQYRAWNVPFPAIAICNVNKISKRKAMNLALEISQQTNINQTKGQILKLLKKLGQFHDDDLAGFVGLQDLENLLTRSDKSATNLLKLLAPDCADLLKKCRWKGKTEDCEQLFTLMNTINGFCCVFNSVYSTNKSRRIETINAPGYRFGLEIVVDADPEDYFYAVAPTIGVQVLIFKPITYPDNTNEIIEYVVSTGKELFLTLHPFSQYASNELRNFKAEERGCYFKDEMHPHYTAANCISGCLMQMVFETCRCIHHFAHNANKFMRLMDHDEEGSSQCFGCLPTCTDTWYDVQSSSANILEIEDSDKFELMKGLPLNLNHSLLHIYNPNLDTTLYKKDVLYTRTELVSNFGGICSLFNGFSFLSLVEIIYFLTLRLYFISRRNDEGNIECPEPNHEPTPYWNEFVAQYHHHHSIDSKQITAATNRQDRSNAW